jgi:hypothetical protein
VRKPYIALATIAGLVTLILWFSLGSSVEREVRFHLSRLEYWRRVQFGKRTWSDALFVESWKRKSDPLVEIAKESAALQSLGYLVKRTFSHSVTNQRGNASLEQAIRRAPLSDAHWEYAYYSNRIEAVICAADLAVWEDIVRKWQQSNSAQPQNSEGMSKKLGNAHRPNRDPIRGFR